MLAQPPDFAIYIYSSDAFALLKKNEVQNFRQNFAQVASNRSNIFSTVAMVLCALDTASDHLQDIIAIYRKRYQYSHNNTVGNKLINIKKRLKL